MERSEEPKPASGFADRRLFWGSIAEATTLAVLVGIAVPLKHLAGQPAAVSVMGPIHGLAFVTYLWLVWEAHCRQPWTAGQWFRLVAAAAIPFAGFTTPFYLRRQSLARTGGGQ